MDNRAKLALVAVSLMLLSGIAVYAIYQIAPLDPLAQFRTADGHLSFPGGALTADLQRLLFPGPAPRDYTVWTPVRSAYPTLAIQGVKYDLPVAAHVPQPIKPLGTDSIKVFLDALARIPKDILSFFMTDAAAADGTCGSATTNNCYWIGGTGNFSDTLSHWSSTTGPVGTPCLCTPAATNAIIFDANSGGGTATQNMAPFTSGPVTLSSTVTTVAAGANTWKVGGNFDISGGTFTKGTSTIEFTASGNLKPKLNGDQGNIDFYKIQVDDTVTVTAITTNVGLDILAINGTTSGGI